MAEYRRRAPEGSLVYQIVAAELDGLRSALAEASPFGAGLPRHVDRELEAYLRCGILAHGFARVVCSRCRAEHLVAFSCKGRGICPSCTTRRMHDTAAHLVDRVLPRVPMRQWVATFPRRVRWHLAADPKLAAEALRVILRVIFAFQRRRARNLGARPTRANSNASVAFVQRFNSALELSLHFHVLIPDGVFVRHNKSHVDTKPRFVAIAPPTDAEVADLLGRIVQRVVSVLRRRGRLDDEVDDEEPEPQLVFASRTPTTSDRPFVEDPLPPLCARQDGFSLHAGTALHANDRVGLERLCRYGLRPPLALGRLTQVSDGTVLYEMKRRFADGRRTLRFSPREFLLRLCALVPPRGFHMVRYAGIFSAHARGRHALTGRGMRDEPARCTRAQPTEPTATHSPAATTARISNEAVPTPRVDLSGPDDAARIRRLAWSTLLRRAWGIDALACPRCEGAMRMIAVIEDARVARQILKHLGLSFRPPPRGHPAGTERQQVLFDEHRSFAD